MADTFLAVFLTLSTGERLAFGDGKDVYKKTWYYFNVANHFRLDFCTSLLLSHYVSLKLK